MWAGLNWGIKEVARKFAGKLLGQNSVRGRFCAAWE